MPNGYPSERVYIIDTDPADEGGPAEQGCRLDTDGKMNRRAKCHDQHIAGKKYNQPCRHSMLQTDTCGIYRIPKARDTKQEPTHAIVRIGKPSGAQLASRPKTTTRLWPFDMPIGSYRYISPRLQWTPTLDAPHPVRPRARARGCCGVLSRLSTTTRNSASCSTFLTPCRRESRSPRG